MKKVHIVGVGGVGTGSFAVALADAGYHVTGSDGKLYEPMKSVLSHAKIQLLEGFVSENLQKVSPDFVIIGNVVRKDNPEAMAWIQSGTPFISWPEAVRTFLIQDRHAIVCSGTHGKTTTSSWVTYLMEKLGLNPSYLIGGVPKDLPTGCRLTDSGYFVGEGDEYDSAFFDKGPKFLHYHPRTLIIANVEFDHADIYRDLAHVKASFEKLVSLVPGDGLVIGRYDDPVVMDLLPMALGPVQTFGVGKGAMWQLGSVSENGSGFSSELFYKGRKVGGFETPLFGEHNLMNLLSGIVAVANLGVPLEKILPLTRSFYGARRRQEILIESPVTLVDDFAHHPTEVRATIQAVRRRFPTGKLFALFEPRSATARRNVHQESYVSAFDSADVIVVSQPLKRADVSSTESFSSDKLVADLKNKGLNATVQAEVDEIVKIVKIHAQPGDIILTMSNGEFGKIQEKLKAIFS